MAMIVKISQDKVTDLSENIEKALRYAGKAMQCVQAMQSSDMEELNERFGMRQGVRGTGPYGRYGRRDEFGYGRRDDYDPDMRPDMGMRSYRDPYYM